MNLTQEEIEESLPKLMNIGYQPGQAWQGNRKGRPKAEQTLKGVLVQLLTPSVRKRLGQNLIDLALNGANDKIRLEATKEIYDRIEGRSRQTIEEHHEGNVIISLLEKVAAEEHQRYIEGEVISVIGELNSESTS